MKSPKLLLLMLTFSMFTIWGCRSAAEKNEAAKQNLKEAQADLKKAEANAAEIASQLQANEEWVEFKRAALAQIEENEMQIDILKIKMSKSGKTFDTLYAKRIERLEDDNASMRMRIISYEKSSSGWESFKAEFTRDMELIGKGLNDLANN